MVWPTTELIPHTDSNNLFFALRGAGSSYAVVTQGENHSIVQNSGI